MRNVFQWEIFRSSIRKPLSSSHHHSETLFKKLEFSTN